MNPSSPSIEQIRQELIEHLNTANYAPATIVAEIAFFEQITARYPIASDLARLDVLKQFAQESPHVRAYQDQFQKAADKPA